MRETTTSWKRKTLALTLSLTAAAMLPLTGHASGFAVVTNGNDSGKGSLRNAVEVLEAPLIYISPSVKNIDISSTISYTSEKALTIIGTGQTVATDQNVTLLESAEGANLTISYLSFVGPGDFSILNRGDEGQDAGKGIFLDVREDQTGVAKLKLNNVSVSGVANHGIHVSDCDLADDCGGGGGGAGEGSDASVLVVFNRVTVDNVGNGRFDADGLRVDDRGAGDIRFFSYNSSFTNVGADGVELDEGNDGKVFAYISGNNFSENGGYCDPSILDPFVPDDMEFELADEVLEEDVDLNFGSPDDTCIEAEFSEFDDSDFIEEVEFGLDLDDGIDFDEAGPGSLVSIMKDSTVNNNLDEGVDYDEEDEGNIQSTFIRVEAIGNTDDGIKHSEEDDGDVFGNVRRTTSMDNGGNGIEFEEEGDGNLLVTVRRSTTGNNDDSDETGIEVQQEDEGEGTLKVINSDIPDGIDNDGVEVIEIP